MTERTLRLADTGALHARPAARLAAVAAACPGRIEVRLGERRADARSILALITLGAGGGALVVVAVALEPPDPDGEAAWLARALDALAATAEGTP